MEGERIERVGGGGKGKKRMEKKEKKLCSERGFPVPTASCRGCQCDQLVLFDVNKNHFSYLLQHLVPFIAGFER